MSNGYGNKDNGNGGGRPGMGTGVAEEGAKKLEDIRTRRLRRTAPGIAAARQARGAKTYLPGNGRKMAQRLREKAQ